MSVPELQLACPASQCDILAIRKCGHTFYCTEKKMDITSIMHHMESRKMSYSSVDNRGLFVDDIM